MVWKYYHITELQNWLIIYLKLRLYSKVETIFITFLNKMGLKAPTTMSHQKKHSINVRLNFSGIQMSSWRCLTGVPVFILQSLFCDNESYWIQHLHSFSFLWPSPRSQERKQAISHWLEKLSNIYDFGICLGNKLK